MPKLFPRFQEDIELCRSMPSAIDDGIFFFRREAGRSVHGVGDRIGEKALYRWWKRACDNLGIRGVDLYGGTRHSTSSALSQPISLEQLWQHGTMHGTNAAFMCYCRGEAKPSTDIYSLRREMSQQKKAAVARCKVFLLMQRETDIPHMHPTPLLTS